MKLLLTIREKIKQFYSVNNKYVDMLVRFIMAAAVLIPISISVGIFKGSIIGILIAVAISLICMMLDTKITVLLISITLLFDFYVISKDLAIIAAIFFIIMYTGFIRYTNREIIIILLTPIAFMLKIPFVIPLAMGLIGTTVSIAPVLFGAFSYYMVIFVSKNVATIGKAFNDETMSKAEYILRGVIENREMIVMLVAVIVSMMLVIFFKKMTYNYAREIALVVGSLIGLVIMLGGNYFYDVAINLVTLIITSIISFLLALFINYMLVSLDYTQVERVQFEDDDYYYYVKAVPKMQMVMQDKVIKHFSSEEEKVVEINEEDLNAVKKLDENGNTIRLDINEVNMKLEGFDFDDDTQ